MNRHEVVRHGRAGNALRLFVTLIAVLLVPVLVAALAAPVVLLLVPAAWFAIPFVIIAMVNSVLSALALELRRATGKPMRQALLVSATR